MKTLINMVDFARRIFGCKDRRIADGRTLGEVVADIIDEVCGKSATVWDGFAGSAYCGIIFKQQGMKVISSDVRPSPWLRATALVGANAPAITPGKVGEIARAVPRDDGWFMQNEVRLIGRQNAGWLDALAEIMPSLNRDERIAATLGVVWATETFLQRGSRFLHMHRSWHGETLCGGWHMRDKDLASEWCRFMIEDYPRLILDNGKENPCLYGDATELVPKIEAQAAYWDFPYAGLFSAYKGSYDLVDNWTKVLLGSDMPPAPEGQPDRRFSSPDKAIPSMSLLMEGAKDIPIWIISYSDADTMRVIPEDIASLAELEGRAVEILRFPFRQSSTKKLAVPKTFNECLIICRAPSVAGTKITIPASHESTHNDNGKKADAADPTCVSLFSGIGGTDFAVSQAGFHHLLACEKDAVARMAYEANFGLVPHPDVLTLDIKDVPNHDLLVAGWPCQATSVGGKRLGWEDARCRLVLETVRIASHARPRAIFLENSNTLPTFDDGRLLRNILLKFEEIGYRGFWRIIEAGDFGMVSQRKRTYVVLFRDDLGIVDFDWPTPSGLNDSCLRDVLLPDHETAHLVINRHDIFINEEAVAEADRLRPQDTWRIGKVGTETPARQSNPIYSIS